MWKVLLLLLPFFAFGNPNVVNLYRSKHGAVPVTENSVISTSAQSFANTLADAGTLYHSGPGENLAFFSGPDDAEYIERAIALWYDEIKDYDFDAPGFSASTGHFTQLVWNQSVQIGTGVATKNGKTFVVQQYKPPGNMLGQFAKNVFPLVTFPPASPSPQMVASPPAPLGANIILPTLSLYAFLSWVFLSLFA